VLKVLWKLILPTFILICYPRVNNLNFFDLNFFVLRHLLLPRLVSLFSQVILIKDYKRIAVSQKENRAIFQASDALVVP
jgi:hypothetical protein